MFGVKLLQAFCKPDADKVTAATARPALDQRAANVIKESNSSKQQRYHYSIVTSSISGSNNNKLSIDRVSDNNVEEGGQRSLKTSTGATMAPRSQRQQAASAANKTNKTSAALHKQVQATLKRKVLGALIVASIVLSHHQQQAQAQQANNEQALSATTTTTTTTTSGTPTATTSTQLPNNSSAAAAVAATTSASFKLKPVNFSLVEELFEAVLPEEEVVKRWRNMDNQLQDGMKAILKMLFPQIVAISQDAKVSGDCSGGILKWILSLRNLRSWAIKMLDATGKPSAGVFEGSLTMFGNYKQCLNIRAPDEDEIEISEQFEEYFRGQFCVIHLKPWMPIKRPFYNLNSTIEALLRKNYKYYEKTLYDELAEIAIAFNFVDIRLDLCVPSTCTMADIQRVAELLSKKVEMRAKVMRCDIASREVSLFNQIDRVTLLWLALPSLLVLITLLASLSSVIFYWMSTKRGRRHSFAFEQENILAKVCKCFTISHHLNNLLLKQTTSEQQVDGVDQEQEQQDEATKSKPLPLYGLRNAFVIWFIIVQLTVELKYQYLRESLPLRDMIMTYWPFQIIINSSFLFESLIIITAFTYSYIHLEPTTNLKNLIVYILDKYQRLMPSIVSLIALTIATPLLAFDSPVWKNFVEQQSSVCKSTGYLNLFFLQNFISYDKICLPHTWLLCVEFQLIIIAVPLVLMLKQSFLSIENQFIINLESKPQKTRQHQRRGFISETLIQSAKTKLVLLSLVLIIVGMALNFISVYTNQLPPSWFYTFPDVAQKNNYFSLYLTKTWHHLSVFMIGFLGGQLCKTILQLRNHNKSTSFQQQSEQPSPSSSTHSPSNHGSTSTIMAMVSQDQKQQHEANKSVPSGCDGGLKWNQFGMTIHHQKANKSPMGLSTMASIICMAAIIFSAFTWSTQQLPYPLVSALYDTFARVLWALSLVVIMSQLCLDTKQTSTVTRLFSHPVLTFMGKISFLAYLITPYINTFILAVQEQALFTSLFLIFHVIVGNIVIIYLIALLLAIVIEQPIRRILQEVCRVHHN